MPDYHDDVLVYRVAEAIKERLPQTSSVQITSVTMLNFREDGAHTSGATYSVIAYDADRKVIGTAAGNRLATIADNLVIF